MKEIIDSRDINKEFILDRIKQEDIFKKYFQIDELDFNKFYVNPFRINDENPGCRFYWDNRGMLKFKDWAGGYNWDCFNIVEYLYNCNFKQALIKIYDHFNLIESDEPTIKNEIKNKIEEKNIKNKTEIKVNLRKWNKKDLEFWNQYYIEEEILNFYNVYPVDIAWVNGLQYYTFKYSDPCYIYFFGNGYSKLYFPFRKKTFTRFIQNSSRILEGSSQLAIKDEFCIITKSYKDVMCFKNFDINAVAPATETILMTSKQNSILRSRFDNVFSLFDNDKTGKRLAIKYKNQYNIPPLLFPKNEEKDFSDNLKKYGYQYMIDYIEETKEKLL